MERIRQQRLRFQDSSRLRSYSARGFESNDGEGGDLCNADCKDSRWKSFIFPGFNEWQFSFVSKKLFLRN